MDINISILINLQDAIFNINDKRFVTLSNLQHLQNRIQTLKVFYNTITSSYLFSSLIIFLVPFSLLSAHVYRSGLLFLFIEVTFLSVCSLQIVYYCPIECLLWRWQNLSVWKNLKSQFLSKRFLSALKFTQTFLELSNELIFYLSDP